MNWPRTATRIFTLPNLDCGPQLGCTVDNHQYDVMSGINFLFSWSNKNYLKLRYIRQGKYLSLTIINRVAGWFGCTSEKPKPRIFLKRLSQQILKISKNVPNKICRFHRSRLSTARQEYIVFVSYPPFCFLVIYVSVECMKWESSYSSPLIYVMSWTVRGLEEYVF